MQSLGLFAVHTSPEALSNLEDGQVLWLDLDGLVGLWVPSRVATVVTDSETAEASQLDPLSTNQCIAHGIKHQIDDFLSGSPGKIPLSRQQIHEF